MKRILLLLVFITATTSMVAQRTLSPSAQVTLLTYDPIDDLYTAFGHSAIRVFDPMQGIDKLYNYGTFDFDAPNFIGKFITGYLNYKLSTNTFDNFQRANEYYERTVHQQVLNLSLDQKQRLYQYLEDNHKPENRYYQYDFFFDNCATRIRDAFEETLGESLQFHYDFLEEENLTFRQSLDLFIENRPWTDLGIDLILGVGTDKQISPRERMYLPAQMMNIFQHATISRNGMQDSLVLRKNIVYQGRSRNVKPNWFIAPITVFSIIFLLVAFLTYRDYKKAIKYRWDGILFILMGIAGCLLLFMWFGTEHVVTKNNFNVLWAFPLHLFTGIMLLKSSWRKSWLKPYFLVSGIVCLVLVLLFPVFPQQFHVAIIPILLLLALRGYEMWRRLE